MVKGGIKRVVVDSRSTSKTPFNSFDEGIDTNGNTTDSESVNIHVGGMTYTLDINDVRRAPDSRLCRYVQKGKTLLNFKRPQQSFEAVLAYYQTGELHMPLSICPAAFATELAYWGLNPQLMSKCCYYRYIAHQDDMETLDRFHMNLFPDEGKPKRRRRYLRRVRSTLWNVLDNEDTSIPTKIYFIVCMLMVVLSVLTLALSTLPQFRRNLTKCEYEKAVGKEIHVVNNSTNQTLSCDQPIDDDIADKAFVDFEIDTETVNTTVAPTPEHTSESHTTTSNNSFMNIDLFGSRGLPKPPAVSDERLVSEIIQTLRPKIGLQKKTVRIQALMYTDLFLLAFFTFDISLRLLCCPSVRRYFLSWINVIDALVVLAAYCHILINYLNTNEQFDTTPFDILEIFQVLRVIRLLRVVRNVTCFRVLSFSLMVSCQDMLVLFLYLILGVAIFANFAFFVESELNFTSIPQGWWWAINTMTTVGYGDIVPKTLYGKLIGAICSVSGVLMMAVAIPVFVKTFLLLYSYAILYKKSVNHPEDTSIYMHRRSTMRMKGNAQTIGANTPDNVTS